MRFARDVKMNHYIYASKTDPYHTSKWGELIRKAKSIRYKNL